MADAVLIALADVVACDLSKASGAWPLAFKAVSVLEPKKSFEEIDTPQVEVMPKTWSMSQAGGSRGRWRYEYTVTVGFWLRANAKAGDQAKEKLKLGLKVVEYIADYYKTRRATIDASTSCAFIAAEAGAGTGLAYDHQSIDSLNTLQTATDLTFWAWR